MNNARTVAGFANPRGAREEWKDFLTLSPRDAAAIPAAAGRGACQGGTLVASKPMIRNTTGAGQGTVIKLIIPACTARREKSDLVVGQFEIQSILTVSGRVLPCEHAEKESKEKACQKEVRAET
jgi:hypothetical protein